MNKISRILALVVFAVVSSVYIVTMEPTVGFIDSGELSLACAEPGIAHPTGYPLYCLFGRLLKMITGLEAILSSNLFSALAGGFTSAMIFLIASLILSSRGKGTAKKSEVIISAACALFFAFTRTFWGTSTVTEVYAFEMALDMCALFFLLLWTKGGGSKFFILGAYLFGLSFGVHMLTILFAPAVLFLIIIERKKLDYRVFFTSIAFFIIGLTIYIYLPLRSTCDPSANFGDPSTFERFFRHVSAWQYRVWMFNRPIAELFVSLKLFGRQLIADTTIFSIPFVIIGLIFLFRKNRTIFFFLTATFLFDVIYALNYTIPDIEAYYLPAIFVWILLVGIGFVWISSKLGKYGIILSIIFFASSIFFGCVRWKRMDRSDYYFVEETAQNILASAPRNSLVYLNNWDYYAPVIYLQKSRGLREDVLFLDYELMRRSWYSQQKLDCHPVFFAVSAPVVEDFIRKVKAFERHEDFSAEDLEKAWRDMHYTIATTALAHRSVCGTFFGGEMEKIFETAPKAGCGCLIEIVPEEHMVHYINPGYIELDEFNRLSDNFTQREKAIVSLYSHSWLSSANAFYNMRMMERAKLFLEADIEYYPEHWNSYKNLAVIQIEQGLFEQAIETFKRAEPYIPYGSYPQMIYDDLKRKIQEKDSIEALDSLKGG